MGGAFLGTGDTGTPIGGTGTLSTGGSGTLPSGGSGSWTGPVPPGGSGGGPCFVGGTSVATPDGPRPIDRLRAGDRVLVRCDGATLVRRVRRLHLGRSGALVDLWTATSSVAGVTPGHGLLDPRTGRFRLAAELAAGDLVLVRTGDGLRPERLVRVERRALEVPVFNLSLDGPGGFYAEGFVASQKREVAGRRPLPAPLLALGMLLACGEPTKDSAGSDPDRSTEAGDADTDADADADTDTDADADTAWWTASDDTTTTPTDDQDSAPNPQDSGPNTTC